ncbi:MAG: alpha/beta hydrolase-fold protein [Nibricoccus sp.]
MMYHNPRLALLAVLLHALFSSVALAEEKSAVTFPPHAIVNSQLHVLPPTSAGRHYQLHIGLPGNYGRDVNKRYPVVFVTDGYWDFEKLHVARGSLQYDKYVPEFIIVGLGYAGENPRYQDLRNWELSPVSFGDEKTSGHAAEFLKTLETEIIPYVDRQFRTDPTHRVLGGASLGGLFTLYTMYTKPELFSGYMAVTPSVIAGNNWLFGYEDAFAHAGRTLKGRLFLSVGGNEWPNFVGAVLRYNSRVVSRKYPDLAYEFRIIEGARHAGMQLESYVRGLTFVLAPLAPESGPLPEL